MSIFIQASATCAKCGATSQADLAASVNAGRRPDLRAAILDGSFQAQDCPNCGAKLRFPAHMTYIDVPRHQWLLVEDVSRKADWRTVEAESQGVYEQGFGPKASAAAQEIGRTTAARLVFGWPALREKLLAAEHGLDDVTLELLKISILRNVEGSPFSDSTELRLTEVAEDALKLHWIDSATEEALDSLSIGRDIYDDLAEDLADDPGPWAPLKADLQAGLYIDMNRLVFA